MLVPPGFVYIARGLPAVLLPSAAAYLAFTRVPQLQFSGSRWVAIVAAVLAYPILFALVRTYTDIWQSRDARRRGAVQMPRVPDPTGGLGLEILSKMGKLIKLGYPAQYFHQWNKKYGYTCMSRIFYEDRIITSEPKYLKAILSTDFDNYWRGPVEINRGHALLGTGVFNADGDMWKFHRSMTRPYFSRERITDFDTFDRHAKDVLDRVTARLNEGYPIDIQDVVARFAVDSATEFLFGVSVDSILAGLAYPQSAHLTSPEFLDHPSNAFVTSFIEGQRLNIDRMRFGSRWQLGEFWKDLIHPHREVMDSFIEPIVQRALNEKARREASGANIEEKEATTLLTHLTKDTQDVGVIRDEILNMLVAGRDTSAAAITLSIYMLAEHPDKARRLREEILNRVGPTGRPTHEDVKNMPYLRAFINETLRLYPPVPMNVRTSKNATTWPSTTGGQPLYVPAKTKIIYVPFLMHRRKDLWGPDALEFDPDRFIDERLGKYLTPNPYIFLPFSAGPRICLGQQFAYQEASFFLIRLLQRFSTITLASDAQPESSKPPAHWKLSELKKNEKITYGASLNLYAQDGLWVRMEA
ncbi:cytochrome P450 monooxygenase pc-3 [Mycena amicta]|nr:cytochrome P450 monooxygenase pc-3 [Mycena amicta]